MCIAAVFPFVSPRKSRNFEYVKNFNPESVSTPLGALAALGWIVIAGSTGYHGELGSGIHSSRGCLK